MQRYYRVSRLSLIKASPGSARRGRLAGIASALRVGLDGVQRFFFHRKIGLHVHVCSCRVFASEPKCNERDIDTGL